MFSSDAPKALAEVNVGRCKPMSTNGQSVNLGLPRSPLLLPSLGKVHVLVAGVDFSNARSTETSGEMLAGFELSKVREFYSTSSYGRLNLEFTLVSEVLNLPISDVGANERIISLETAKIVPASYNFSDYRALLIVTTKNSSYSSSTASAASIVENSTGRITNYSVLAGIKPNESRWLSSPWRTVAHEVGHLLGLMDLWNREDSAAWQGQTAAPFSLMNTGAGWGYAADFFAWEKWILGWIPESGMKCSLLNSNEEEIGMTSLGSSDGIRLVVIPISDTKVVAIEYRELSPLDFGITKSGFLVYVVDTSKRNFELPIMLVPSEDSLQQPLNQNLKDYERFKKAPLAKFDLVETNGLNIANLGMSENKVLLLSKVPKSELKQRLVNLANQEKEEAEARAALELRLKQEAEAKAEAELKAKQEAEAKAVAELKAKQEAEAKAAAEKAATVTATKKKTTITCIKGKTVKKVKAINPKCPKGFKKR